MTELPLTSSQIMPIESPLSPTIISQQECSPFVDNSQQECSPLVDNSQQECSPFVDNPSLQSSDDPPIPGTYVEEDPIDSLLEARKAPKLQRQKSAESKAATLMPIGSRGGIGGARISGSNQSNWSGTDLDPSLRFESKPAKLAPKGSIFGIDGTRTRNVLFDAE